MKLLFDLLARGILFLPLMTLSAQEGSWSVVALGGVAYLDLHNVDEDNRSDVEGYRRVYLNLPDFPSLRRGFAFGAKISYRLERDYSLSLMVHESSRSVRSVFSRPEDSLSLTRSVGSTAFLLGIAQHFEPVQDILDWHAELHIGLLFARAGSAAFQTHTYKKSEADPTPITEITDNTRGEYRKTKLIVGGALGGTLSVLHPFILKAEVGYRFAKVGKMETNLQTLNGPRYHETSVVFDYSGFLFLLGVGIEL
jgi:hypothetical protein